MNNFCYKQRKGKPSNSWQSRGFTLIELLVVIGIIGILASIILVSLNSARSKARDSQRISDLKTLQGELENYFASNGAYPNPGSQQIWDTSANWSTVFSSTLVSSVPHDPSDTVVTPITNCATASTCHVYTYCIDATASNYILGVNLEGAPTVAQTNPTSPVNCPISASGSNIYWINN